MRAPTHRRTESRADGERRPEPRSLLAVCALAFLGVLGCGSSSGQSAGSSSTNDSESGAPAAATFAEVYTTILAPICKTCHQPSGIAPFQDFSTQSSAYAALVGVKASGPSCGAGGEIRVVAGQASQSLLFLKVSQTSPPCGSQMPLGGPPLPGAQVSLIEDWINDGAKND